MIVNKKKVETMQSSNLRIGYACINNSIGCIANSTFRLANYSEENLIAKIENNLSCLFRILKWNIENKIYFFRISSDLVPFASHPVCKFDWVNYFKKEFKEIGDFIKNNNIRISMHPDQFVLINAKDEKIIQKSIAELEYHAKVLDALGLDKTAKIQIHVGGVYDDKTLSVRRFVDNFKLLPENVKRRLVIENEERLYSLKDCLQINSFIGIPVLFDVFHHFLYNNKEGVSDSIKMTAKTWNNQDGNLMMDYSSQKEGGRFGAHADSIDLKDFELFIKEVIKSGVDIDLMLEIKDKEKSALRAIEFYNSY